jgi:hypothetical protein
MAQAAPDAGERGEQPEPDHLARGGVGKNRGMLAAVASRVIESGRMCRPVCSAVSPRVNDRNSGSVKNNPACMR